MVKNVLNSQQLYGLELEYGVYCDSMNNSYMVTTISLNKAYY